MRSTTLPESSPATAARKPIGSGRVDKVNNNLEMEESNHRRGDYRPISARGRSDLVFSTFGFPRVACLGIYYLGIGVSVPRDSRFHSIVLPSSLAHSLRMRGRATVMDIAKGSKPGSSEWSGEPDLRKVAQADGKRQPMCESDTRASEDFERAAMSSRVALTEHVFPVLSFHCQNVRATLGWTPE